MSSRVHAAVLIQFRVCSAREPQLEYTLKYCNGLEALNTGDEATLLMLKVLPGRSKHIARVQLGLQPSDGFDSHASANHLECEHKL